MRKKKGFGKKKKEEGGGRESTKAIWDGFQEESFRILEKVGLEAALMHCFVNWRDAGGCMARWGRRERGTLRSVSLCYECNSPLQFL